MERQLPRLVHDRRKTRALVLILACLVVTSCGANEFKADERSADLLAPPLLPGTQSNMSLGALLVTNAPGWSRALMRPDVKGALVLAVLPGSAADSGGMAPGDVIVGLDGRKVGSADVATRAFRTAKGSRHTIVLTAPGGSTRGVKMELGPPAQSAQAYLERRLEQAPDTVGRYLVALLAPDPGTVLPLTEELVNAAPEFAAGRALHARVLLESERRDGRAAPEISAAKAEMARAMELDPSSGDIFTSAARLFLDLGEPVLAESAATRAVVNEPDSAKANHVLGQANLALERPAIALANLRRAVELDPYSTEMYETLALGYTALGQESSARATQQVARSLRTGAFQRRLGAEARQVGVGILAVMGLIGAPLFLTGRRQPDTAATRREGSEHQRLVNMAEALTILGAWSVAIPYAGPALGLAPPADLKLEIIDHVVPGVVIAAASLTYLLLNLNRPHITDQLRLVPPAVFLAGLWVVASHAGLVVAAAQQRIPWSIALFHSLPGLPVLLLAALLYAYSTRSAELRHA